MKFVGLILAIIFVAGCSKEVQKNKQFDGVWKPVTLTIFNYNGLKNEVPILGFIKFSRDGKKSKSGTYEFAVNYTFQGNDDAYIDHGTYVIDNGNVVTLKSAVDASETMSTIVYITKDDLKFEIPNKNFLGYYFLMKKEK